MLQLIVKLTNSVLNLAYRLYYHLRGYNHRLHATNLSTTELKQLLRNKLVDPNYTRAGFTPLHRIGFLTNTDNNGKDHFPERIAFLLSAGANPNAQTNSDHFCYTPLHLLIANQLIKHAAGFVEMCIKNRAGFDFTLKDSNGCTPFNLACKLGQTELALSILEFIGYFNPSIDMPDNEGMTPLNYAALLGQERLFFRLSKYGYRFTPNAKFQCIENLLESSTESIKMHLLQNKIDPNRDCAARFNYFHDMNLRLLSKWKRPHNDTFRISPRNLTLCSANVSTIMELIESGDLIESYPYKMDGRIKPISTHTIAYIKCQMNALTGLSLIEQCLTGRKIIQDWLNTRSTIGFSDKIPVFKPQFDSKPIERKPRTGVQKSVCFDLPVQEGTPLKRISR